MLRLISRNLCIQVAYPVWRRVRELEKLAVLSLLVLFA